MMDEQYLLDMSYHFARIIVKWKDEDLLNSADVMIKGECKKELDLYLYNAILFELGFRNLFLKHKETSSEQSCSQTHIKNRISAA